MIVSHDYGYDEEDELFDDLMKSLISMLMPIWTDEIYRPRPLMKFLKWQR